MEQKKTKIYLNYLDPKETEIMTEALPFLRNGGEKGKTELIELANDLYGGETKLELAWDNGNYPRGYRAYGGGKHYLTIMEFQKRQLTKLAIKMLGCTDSSNFPYTYAIMLCREDRRLYVASFSDCCSPNWNQEYSIECVKPIEDVDIPLLQRDGVVFRMDDALHGAINQRLAQNRPMFTEEKGCVTMMVCDQHGNYMEIEGTTVEQVFRKYADNCTGYRNFRRQMASEWAIVDEITRNRFEQWKKTAKSLKSDFDKFYGGGIVD